MNSTAEPSKVREIKIQNDHLKKAVEQSRKLDLKGKGLPLSRSDGQPGGGLLFFAASAPGNGLSRPPSSIAAAVPRPGPRLPRMPGMQGFLVLSITTGNPMDQTQVLINSGSSRAEERVGSLPFN